jgi:hypothetical protein
VLLTSKALLTKLHPKLLSQAHVGSVCDVLAALYVPGNCIMALWRYVLQRLPSTAVLEPAASFDTPGLYFYFAQALARVYECTLGSDVGLLLG